MNKLLLLIGLILLSLLIYQETQKQLKLPLDHPHKIVIIKLIQQK